MDTVRIGTATRARRLAAVALAGALPALAVAIGSGSGQTPAGSASQAPGTSSSQVPPAQSKPLALRRADLRAAEIEQLAVHISKTWKKPLPQTRRIVQAAFAHAQQQRLSPTLVLAVVAQESSFRPTAQSGYGAQGLMQVVPRHHPEKVKGLGRNGLLAPETNIAVGTQVLAEYIDRRNGQVDAALISYSGKATAYPQKIRLVWNDLERVRHAAEASV